MSAEAIPPGHSLASPADAAREERVALLKQPIDPTAPLDIARLLLFENYTRGAFKVLHHWNGSFFEYRLSHYEVVPDHVMRARIYAWLHTKKTPDGAPVKPKKRMVDDVLDALRAAAILESNRAPCWIEMESEPISPEKIIACHNGLVHTESRVLIPPDVRFFTNNALPFDYDPRAGSPVAFLSFLDEVFDGDGETIDSLQEWFGYVLTTDTDQQKVVLLVGPTRSGKGTIARVLRELVGPGNCCAPTLSTFGQPFGLAGLIGKLLALLSDVRVSGRADMSAITETILRISGQDAISVPQKFKPDWVGQLGVRFFLISNELPAFVDASGALAGRFLVYQTRRGFYGKEDPGLTNRLLQELPEIFNWALDGLERLRQRGHFVQPASSREALDQMALIASPIKAFLADRCRLEPGASVPVDDLFAAWSSWCEEQRRDKPGTKQLFGKNLSAAAPFIKITKPRDKAGDRRRRYEGIRLLHDWEIDT